MEATNGNSTNSSKNDKMEATTARLTIREDNPLLVDLVLDQVMSYVQGFGTEYVKDYRVVCKKWNNVITRLLRPKTKINLIRLVSPYPEGLGWTKLQDGYRYECPYYNDVNFVNIMVTGTCQNLIQPNYMQWFEIMGSTVKSIHLKSSLSCYHQSRFVECTLKRWCPNLEALNLYKITCFMTLTQISSFTDPTEIGCRLKQLVLSTDGDLAQCTFGRCKEEGTVPAGFLKYPNTDVTILDKEFSMSFEELQAYGIEMLNEIADDTYEGIREDVRHHILATDGGVLGQIFKTATIDKFVLMNLSTNQCRDVAAVLSYRPHKFAHSMKHLVLPSRTTTLTSTHLAAFRMLHMPLSTIRFGTAFAVPIAEHLTRFLSSFADTLEILDFNGNRAVEIFPDGEQEEAHMNITLPLLPKLKRFANRNIETCRSGGFGLLLNLPNLVTCVLTYNHLVISPHEINYELFDDIQNEVRNHPLKELRLSVQIIEVRHIELIEKWLPNLNKIDLKVSGTNVFLACLRMSSSMNLAVVKLSFSSNNATKCNDGIQALLPRMINLKFLSLLYLPDSPLTLKCKTFQQGFALSPVLTSLRLTNFGFFTDELTAIRDCMSHLSCLKLFNAYRVHRPINVEFNASCNTSGPA